MITAESITDEQIRELRDGPPPSGSPAGELRRWREMCGWALERGHVQRYAARARCAEILNARAKEQP